MQSVFALNITKYVVVLLCLISLFNGVDFIAAVLYALYVNEANCARNWARIHESVIRRYDRS